MKHTEFTRFTSRLASTVTAVAALGIMAAIGTATVLQNQTALFSPTADDVTGEIPSLKTRLTEAFDEGIFGFSDFLWFYGKTQKLFGASVYEDAGVGYLIRDSKDFFHYNTLPADAAPYASAVADLRDTLADADIPFLYLQSPSKEIDGYTDFPPGIEYASTGNAADMRDALRAHGVEVLSFIEKFAENNIPPETQFYRTDHHWTTETAFEAFRIVLPYLNERFGWSLNTALCDSHQWQALYQPQSFLGSIGRRVGEELAGLDDYTFLEPQFETAYNIYYPPSSTEVPYWTGNFHQTIVRDSLLYSEDVSANRYASYFQYDYGELIIENLSADNDLHIAILKDSFALPFTAFLSTAVGKIDMIDLREFTGSVTEHLLTTQPDLVIMMYSNSSFNEKAIYAFHD